MTSWFIPIALGAAAVAALALSSSKPRRRGSRGGVMDEGARDPMDGDDGRDPEDSNDDDEPGPRGETFPGAQGGDTGIVNQMNISPEGKRHGTREPWAVVLHQMGFQRGDDPSKYAKVTAHYIIAPDGTIAQNHPVESLLYASNGFNEGGIAIEFAGNFPSRQGSTDPDHFYKPEKFGMDQLTREQIASGRWLLQYLRDIVLPDLGLELTVVLAHRQSSDQRGNDPGPDVWANIGQWAVDHLGLSDGGEGFAVGDGQPILDHWRTVSRGAISGRRGLSIAGRHTQFDVRTRVMLARAAKAPVPGFTREKVRMMVQEWGEPVEKFRGEPLRTWAEDAYREMMMRRRAA